MLVVGNGELDDAKEVGVTVECKKCSKTHNIKYGKDEYGKYNNLLAFYTCGDRTYLYGVNGKVLLK